MIATISGDVGSGKSYFAVWSMLAAARREPERPICSNLPVTDAFRERIGSTPYHQLQDDEVSTFWKHTPAGSRIFLDEVHLYFDSRQWATLNKDAWSYICQIRHHGDELWLVTQRMAFIEKRMRELAMLHVVTFAIRSAARRLGVEGLMGWLIPDYFIVRRYGDSDLIGVEAADDTSWLRCRKQVYECYDSWSLDQHHAVGRLQDDVRAANKE